LSEARKYKLNLIIAHQYIEQMIEEVRAAVFGNVGTTVTFRVGAYDAETLEKEFSPTFEAADLVNLDKFQIYLKLMIDGVGSLPFSANTIPNPPPLSPTFVPEILKTSREQFAERRDIVEQKIINWHKDNFRNEAPRENSDTKNAKKDNGEFAPRQDARRDTRNSRPVESNDRQNNSSSQTNQSNQSNQISQSNQTNQFNRPAEQKTSTDNLDRSETPKNNFPRRSDRKPNNFFPKKPLDDSGKIRPTEKMHNPFKDAFRAEILQEEKDIASDKEKNLREALSTAFGQGDDIKNIVEETNDRKDDKGIKPASLEDLRSVLKSVLNEQKNEPEKVEKNEKIEQNKKDEKAAPLTIPPIAPLKTESITIVKKEEIVEKKAEILAEERTSLKSFSETSTVEKVEKPIELVKDKDKTEIIQRVEKATDKKIVNSGLQAKSQPQTSHHVSSQTQSTQSVATSIQPAATDSINEIPEKDLKKILGVAE
jgi:hypothetical protein